MAKDSPLANKLTMHLCAILTFTAYQYMEIGEIKNSYNNLVDALCNDIRGGNSSLQETLIRAVVLVDSPVKECNIHNSIAGLHNHIPEVVSRLEKEGFIALGSE